MQFLSFVSGSNIKRSALPDYSEIVPVQYHLHTHPQPPTPPSHTRTQFQSTHFRSECNGRYDWHACVYLNNGLRAINRSGHLEGADTHTQNSFAECGRSQTYFSVSSARFEGTEFLCAVAVIVTSCNRESAAFAINMHKLFVVNYPLKMHAIKSQPTAVAAPPPPPLCRRHPFGARRSHRHGLASRFFCGCAAARSAFCTYIYAAQCSTIYSVTGAHTHTDRADVAMPSVLASARARAHACNAC